MKETRRITRAYDIVFDSTESYRNSVAILDWEIPITYYAMKEVMEFVDIQIKEMVPAEYRSEITLHIESVGKDFPDHRQIVWVYTPKVITPKIIS